MTTKERIVEEALTLFSKYGYKGTSMKNIADAVGIKDSSIYKHYKSKKDIAYAIVDQMKIKIDNMSIKFGLPYDTNREKEAAVYGSLTLEQLKILSRKVFMFYLQDEYMSRFWRFAIMEQYHDTEIYEVYRDLFFEKSIAYQKSLFAEMIKQGSFIAADPEVVAINYYSPIFFLLSKYSGRKIDEDKVLKILDKQVEEFYRIYKVQ